MQYGCIGEHLKHSFSTEIHNALGDYPFELKEIPRDNIDAFMQARAFNAITVTIPYKQAVIPHLYYIHDTAKEIGAVNTVVNKDGKLYGYNTDFGGMVALIERAGISLADKKVLILGTGGTCRTAKAVAKHLGAAAIYTVGRHAGKGDLTYSQAVTHADTDILINTTPCGMFGNAAGMAIDPALFPNLSGVVDVVYNPLRTPLVLAARRCGIPAVCGLYMLVMQAVLASALFFDKTYDPAVAENVYRKIKSGKENIVLTGMPSCGKSTVGKLLAEKLGRPFLDIDTEIEKTAGATPAAIIAAKGEAAFRDIETAVIREISTKNGAIIATGGGAVLREENIDNLRSNGKLFFLNRALDLLTPTSDRPLSSDRATLQKRFAERYDLYCATADAVIDGNGTPDAVATAVERSFFA